MRQHINLSLLAYSTIKLDLVSCSFCDSLSSIISLILKNYYNSPNVSIHTYCQDERLKLESSFRRFDSDYEETINDEADDYFIHKVVLGYAEKRLSEIPKYPNQVTLKVYISDTLADMIDNLQDYEVNMFRSPSDFSLLDSPRHLSSRASYIKNILESYARLPIYDRHCILYKDIYDRICTIEKLYYSDTPNENRLNLMDITFLKDAKPVRTIIKPYRISLPHETHIPHLLCYAPRETDTGRKYGPDRIPLHQIESYKMAPNYMNSGKLTRKEKDTIEKMMILGFEEAEFTVSFTPEGLNDYLADQMAKPYSDPSQIRIASDGRLLLDLSWDAWELTCYLATHGDSAIIVHPYEYTEAHTVFHKEAYQAYLEHSISEIDWSSNEEINAEIQSCFEKIKSRKISWSRARAEYRERNHNPSEQGIYPYFIKVASERGILNAYAEYADMLFEGIVVSKDYNKAGLYYSKVKDKLTLSQKYNMASIYINGLCPSHAKEEGQDILTFRNEQKEPVFHYKSLEGYTFYAPKIPVEKLTRLGE